MSITLSLLEQVPVFHGSSAAAAAIEAVALGIEAERLQFNRFWVAEHHQDPTRGCASPEVLAAFVGARTSVIRVGAGCVLLPQITPLRAAEQFCLLDALCGGRADLGLGRGASAPGTFDFARQVADVLSLLDDDTRRSQVVPGGQGRPDVWCMAASERGALTAATLGLPMAFAQFAHNDVRGDIADVYRSNFRPRPQQPEPSIAVAVRVNCAETTRLARQLALAIWLPAAANGWTPPSGTGPAYPSLDDVLDFTITPDVRQYVDDHPYVSVAGDPVEVVDRLADIAEGYGTTKLILTTTCPDLHHRIRTLGLIVEELAHRDDTGAPTTEG